MTKRVQGRTGDSLAGIYDVVGGAVDVAHLEDTEVQLTHDMGELTFSERLRSDIRYVEALAQPQTTTFSVTIDDLPGGPFRIHTAVIQVSDVSRLSFVTLSLELGDASRGIPLLTWETVADSTRLARWMISGALSTPRILIPGWYALPVVALGRFQAQPLHQTRILRLSGTTTTFGAGTVDVRAHVLTLHTEIPGGQQQPRSYGLPVPSW